ncbi:class I SAM-dependent methyltransferase [Nocardiopsis sp. JB363]|uniref:class I SAM-dependent methyltransferase n=1 Tax=Nocardiopsis sp. JB363 TaxID=1434837 RepID=UPI00097A31D8|nr:class I SAM-dependent methyltransferase [Nocardiopsis sp. JB363]SIO84477.1 Vng1025h [Nocardiopsis sp. JB363]
MSPTPDHSHATFTPEWLALREEADTDARATAPLDPLRAHLTARGAGPGGRPIRVTDLGCGTGAQGRWLAPRLAGPQTWMLHDLDPRLLNLAGAHTPRTSADGSTVQARMHLRDLNRISATDLADTDLVTGSALLDLLTRDQVLAIARAADEAGCAALFTLTVTGRVDLYPSHPADPDITTAFNDHQRRAGLLGPDATAFTAQTFLSLGRRVLTYPSPWRLLPEHTDLTRAWLRGRLRAATEQHPASVPSDYPRHRLDQCERRELGAVVHHTDLLALPDGYPGHP